MRLLDIAEKGDPIAKSHDFFWTNLVMAYEHGSVIRSLMKARVAESHGEFDVARAYEEGAKVELADLITQCYFLAEQKNWERIDLENIGLERFQERMKEYQEGFKK